MPPPRLSVTLVAFSCCQFISAKCAYNLCSKFGFLYEFVFRNNFINSLSPILFYKFNIMNFSRINLQIWKSSKKFVWIRATSFWFVFAKSVLCCEQPVRMATNEEIEGITLHFLQFTDYYIMTCSNALLLSILKILKLSNLQTRMGLALMQ